MMPTHNEPFSNTLFVCISKCDLSSLPHKVLEILEAAQLAVKEKNSTGTHHTKRSKNETKPKVKKFIFYLQSS